MFGLLNPGRQDHSYRRAYARCCQHQRKHYGLPSLSFLSYESILLYLVATDAGKVSFDNLPATSCCKLRRLPSTVDPDERDVARFCTSLGILLASIKLTDDLRDGPSLFARVAHWMLKSRFREVYDYFRRLDSDFEHRVESLIAEHLALEQRSEPATVEEYVQPTAHAFGYVFSLMARLSDLETHRELLNSLGEHVGSAIIAFDCAVDRDRDRRRGEYNPLPEGEEAICGAALALSRRHLYLAADLCCRRFGAGSHAGRVLLSVAQCIPTSRRVSTCERFQSETRRWSPKRRPGMQLNEGFDICFGIASFVAVCFGAIACLFSSSKKPGGCESESEQGKIMDVPPLERGPDVPLDPATIAAASAVAGQQKKKDSGCFMDGTCCDCPSCDPCTDFNCGGCENVDCSGCGDGCGGCDISCG